MNLPSCFTSYYDKEKSLLECPFCHCKIKILHNLLHYDVCCGFQFKISIVSGTFYYFSIPFSNNGASFKLMQFYKEPRLVIYSYMETDIALFANKYLIDENIIVDWNFENIKDQLETYLLLS